MERKGRFPFRALETGVARWRMDNEREAHVPIEIDSVVKIGSSDRKSDLIEIHVDIFWL